MGFGIRSLEFGVWNFRVWDFRLGFQGLRFGFLSFGLKALRLVFWVCVLGLGF